MANSSVLSLVQSYCREYGLPVPTALQGSTDAGSLQMRELLTTVGEDIWDSTNWQTCLQTASWSSVPAISQGQITSLAPNGFSHIIADTFWDNTQRLPMQGPLSEIEWQATVALTSSRPQYSFRLVAGSLDIYPVIPAGHALSFMYKSRYWITASSVRGARYLNDADVADFPDALMKAGLRAYWLRIKQMPHKLELDKYENLKVNEAGKNGVKPTLHMDNSASRQRSGIYIPIGNWTVP